MAITSSLKAILTAPEAAKRHKLTRRYIQYLVSRGTVAGRKAAGAWLVDEASLKQYLSKKRRPGPKTRKKPR